MTAGTYLRGNKIQFVEGEWIFADTGFLVEKTWREHGCGHCGKKNDLEFDPCIGELPCVMNACCGHGEIDEAYVQFQNGSCWRGYPAKFAIVWLKGLAYFKKVEG